MKDWIIFENVSKKAFLNVITWIVILWEVCYDEAINKYAKDEFLDELNFQNEVNWLTLRFLKMSETTLQYICDKVSCVYKRW